MEKKDFEFTEKDFGVMEEKFLAIVDFGKEKKFYVVERSNLQSFLTHHSSTYLSCPPPIIFQSVLVYDPIVFQSQLDSLWKSQSTSNSSNN